VGNAGHNHAVDVGEYLVERLALRRGCRRQFRANLPRFYTRQNREALDMGLVISNPVDDGVTLPPEFFGRHVEAFFC